MDWTLLSARPFVSSVSETEEETQVLSVSSILGTTKLPDMVMEKGKNKIGEVGELYDLSVFNLQATSWSPTKHAKCCWHLD